MAKPTSNKVEKSEYTGHGVKTSQPDNDTKNKIVERFTDARRYAENSFFETWDDCWKVYNNQRTSRANYESIADTFVPETFTIVESVLANVAGGKPKFEFWPISPEQTEETDILTDLADFYWTQNRLGFKIIPWVRDAIMYGTGIIFTTWNDKGFTAQHVPLKDFFIDPTAKVLDDPTDLNSAEYAGFRYLTTVEELERREVVNPDFDPDKKESKSNPRTKKLYKNLDKIDKTSREQMEMTDKEEKDMYLGSTMGGEAKDKQVEVIYYVDRDKLVEVANRNIVIREEETPFKRDAETVKSHDDNGVEVEFELPEIEPFLPFAALRNYIDGSLFYAKGDVEVILDVQEHLNDTANQKVDNLSYILNRMFTIDPAYADKIDEIDSVPGAVFPIPPGGLDQIQTQPLGLDADNELSRNTDMMRRATAADELVQGAAMQKSRTTATEIEAQLSQAGTRFQMKLNVLEQEGYAQLASNMFKLIQLNVDEEMAVRKVGPKGVEWKNYNPGDFMGEYEPHVILDTTAAIRKEEERMKWIEFWQMAQALPFIDQQYAFVEVAKKLFDMDDETVQAFIQEQQVQPNAAEGAPQGVTPSDVSPEQMDAMMQDAMGPGDAMDPSLNQDPMGPPDAGIPIDQTMGEVFPQ